MLIYAKHNQFNMNYKDFYKDELNENPEIVLGEYPRWEYNSYLFMGTSDAKGLIYTPIKNRPELTHAMMYRTFIKNLDNDIDVKILGDVSSGKFDHEMSGVVVPKQNGIEKTIVSLWSDKCLQLKPVLSQLLGVLGVKMPAELEISDFADRSVSKTCDF